MQAFGALWLWSDLFLAISAIMNPWCLFQYSYLLTKLSKMACFKTAANSNKPGMHMTTRTYLCMCIVHLPIKLVLLLVRYKLYGWNRTVCTSRTWACAHTRRHHQWCSTTKHIFLTTPLGCDADVSVHRDSLFKEFIWYTKSSWNRYEILKNGVPNSNSKSRLNM